MDPGKREKLLREHALRRWEQKVAFVEKRVRRDGWSWACHQMALEVLGYARNRAPMSRLAALHPLAEFEAGVDVEMLYAREGKNWRVLGSRPANHPRNRLRQYAALAVKQPDWPAKLHVIFESTPELLESGACAEFRRTAGTKALQERVAGELFSGLIGERRVNTILCDALFPAWQAATGRAMRGYWLHWYPGDVPDQLVRFVRRAGLATRDEPMSNGLFQGLLGWLIEGQEKARP
jgi:hypothetical protein